MYRLVNLSKYYNSDNKVNKALDNISLEIKEKEFVMISGPSGSGKSTLLNVLSGIDSYQDGEMYFNDQETSYYDEKDYEDFRFKNISFVFQEYNLLESYTCYENIEVALVSKNINYTHNDIINVLKKVNLEDKEKVKVAKLSGGQKARLAIARALAFNSPILVLDEPTGALDSKSSEEVVNLLKELKGSKTIILVTHNEELFNDVANHHIRILDGKIKEDKLIEEITVKNINENYEIKKYNKEIKIAKLNIKNQPKKSILSFVLCFALTLFIFLIISNLSYMSNSGTVVYSYNNSPDRIQLSKDNGFNEEDYKVLEENTYQIIKEDTLLNMDIIGKDLTSFNIYGNSIINSSHLKNDELVIGRLPTSNDEIIIPDNADVANNFSKFQDKNINIYIKDRESNYFVYSTYKVVGVSDNYNYYIKDALDLNNIVFSYYTNKLFTLKINPNLFIDNSLKDDKLYKSFPEDIIHNGNKLDAIIEDNDIARIRCNINYLAKLVDKNPSIISVYTKDVESYIKNIDSKYNYYIPNVLFKGIDFNRIFVTFTSVIMGVLIYLLVFLTNIITKQIYKYKNKDNAILNSLGYSNQILKKELAIELTLNYVISITILLIAIICDYTTNCFNSFFTYNSVYSYLIILLIILIVIYVGIKNVFKMFSNNSLFKNLRGGDLDA